MLAHTAPKPSDQVHQKKKKQSNIKKPSHLEPPAPHELHRRTLLAGSGPQSQLAIRDVAIDLLFRQGSTQSEQDQRATGDPDPSTPATESKLSSASSSVPLVRGHSIPRKKAPDSVPPRNVFPRRRQSAMRICKSLRS